MHGMKSAKKAVKKAAVARKKAAAKKAGRVARKVAREDAGIPVAVRNLGPIARADLQLKPLTIFVGPNGTGKTFVCKAIHSAIGAMIANPGGELFHKYDRRIRFFADALKQEMPKSVRHAHAGAFQNSSGAESAEARSSNFFAKLEDGLDDIKRRASSLFFEDEFIEQSIADLRKKCDGLLVLYRKNRQALVKTAVSTPARERPVLSQIGKLRPRDIRIQTKKTIADFSISEDDLRGAAILGCAGELWRAISALAKVEWDDKITTIREGVGNAFHNGVAANFQIVPHDVLGELGSADAEISIANMNFTLAPEAGVVEFARGGVHTMRKWSRTLFLDSPVYWKLKSALENMRMSDARRRELDGVPQYFYDIAILLRKKLTASNFSEMSKELEEIIGGKIVVDPDTNTLRFRDKRGREYSMHATAGGIVNLGVLSLLIEHGIVAKNTIVFVDEPESNLHPKWQTIIAETLARLAGAGVHVVIATHSDWMLDAVANLVRQGETNSGEGCSLKEDDVNVYWFGADKSGKGSKVFHQPFDNDNGYLPKDVREESTALYNKAVPLQIKLDEMRDK